LVWDDQMFRLYGISREQFTGAYDAWKAGVHPDDRERCDAEVAAALRGEREFETEFRVVWPDGTVRDIRALASVLRDTAGAPLRMIGTNWDITEPKAAGAAFERSLVDLREAQRIAHVGSWSWDAAPDAVTWSVELFHIFGLAPSATAPSFAEHLVMYTEESRGRLVADVSRAMETGEGFEAQVEIVRPDGTKRLGVSHGEAVRDANGVIVGLRGTVADLTELRGAEARADRAQRAEMVGRLAGGVAHDFNNLLAVINGHAEFLADSIPADDPRREDVDAIHATGARAAALARQLLAFGRRQTLRPSIVDIDDVVDALAPMLRSIVGDDVELVVPRDHPVGHVRVDRAELEQAIVNLVLNARDAMPGGGRVTIATSDIAVDVGDPWLRPPAVPGDYVRLTVADTGTGMDAETLSHVFEPFYTTKLRDKGTGLGLSSVEGAIAQSGGFVTVESELGRGSSFSIHLPRAFGEPVTAPPSVSRSAPRDGRETILLVEDQPGVRAITAHTLRELGYAVIDASDPTAALAMAEAAPKSFDILVTDVIMPGVSGRELADRLTALHPGLPTLYMSGYSPEEVFGPGLLDEGTSFLAKPFDRADLAARVRALIDRRAADAG
ncbi:MAG: PAS domain-containing protein, partial [Chloroflexota bacterium]